MQISFEIEPRNFVKSLNKISREDKLFIAEKLEQNLLSEWDEYEDSDSVKNRIEEARIAYMKGDVTNLKDLL